MNWKDILKSTETEDKLLAMKNVSGFLEKAKVEVEKYVLSLLKKRFKDTESFKDIKEEMPNSAKGVKFKLGELTIDPYWLSMDVDVVVGKIEGIVAGHIYFNNVYIGEISALPRYSQYSVEIQYNGYYGGDPEDVAIAELYKKIKGEKFFNEMAEKFGTNYYKLK